MNFIKSKFLRTVTSMLLIVAMAVGLAAGMEKKADAASITITYNLTSGQVSPYDSSKTVKKTYTAGWITLEKSSYYYPGKSIIGWATKSGGSKVYDPGQRVQITSSITLYAIWGSGTATCSHSKYTQQIIVQSTCTRDGKARCVCSSCGKTWEKTLTAPGHKYGNTITVKPTCEKGGESYQTCIVCKSKKTLSTTKATGHKWVVWAYHDQNYHDVYCEVCDKLDVQAHQWKLKTYGTGGHWYECSSDGCNEMKKGSYVECYTKVTNWSYFVDNKSTAGKNLYVREGDCTICKTHVIEHGLSTFQKSPRTVSTAIELFVAGAKFALSFYPAGAVIKGVFKIHTAVNLIKKGIALGKEIKATCDNSATSKKLADADLEFMKNLEYITPSTQQENSAINLFQGSRDGITSVYQAP